MTKIGFVSRVPPGLTEMLQEMRCAQSAQSMLGHRLV
jgi:hypothetical protein